MGKWKLRHRMGILFAVLILDSAVFGMSAGVMKYLSDTPESGGRTEGRELETGGGFSRTASVQNSATARNTVKKDPLPGDAPALENGREGSQSNKSQSSKSQSNRSQNSRSQSNRSQDSIGKKQIALTFDDGPHAEYTPKLLDGLKERNVRATFFLMGQNIPGNEELIRRMQEEGHLIGNHSYRHVQLTREGEESVCEAVEKTSSLIAQITGQTPQYLRPPYGDWSEGLECRLDLTPVFWSVDSLDWKLKNTAKIVRRVEKSAGEGDIILMHDIFQTSVDAALALVDDLQKQGYEFVTVDELVIE